jgi:hypothetical protein
MASDALTVKVDVGEITAELLSTFDPNAIRALTFASEDNLSKFALALSDEEAAALYCLLYLRGCRYDALGVAKWRRSR